MAVLGSGRLAFKLRNRRTGDDATAIDEPDIWLVIAEWAGSISASRDAPRREYVVRGGPVGAGPKVRLRSPSDLYDRNGRLSHIQARLKMSSVLSSSQCSTKRPSLTSQISIERMAKVLPVAGQPRKFAVCGPS